MNTRMKTRIKAGFRAFLITGLVVLSSMTVAKASPPDRTTPPAVGQPAAVVLPTIEKRELSNGVPVWFALRTKVPMAHVFVMFRTGSDCDPVGKYGLASMTADALDEGCGSYSSVDFAQAVSMLGAKITADSAFDYMSVSLDIPTSRIDKGLALLADCIMRPNFEQKEFDRMYLEGLTSFLQMRDDPDFIAGEAILKTIYPANDRYCMSSSGDAQCFARLTREDLVNFHQALMTPRFASVVVSGDVNIEQTMSALEQQLGSWKDNPSATMAYVRNNGLKLVDGVCSSRARTKAANVSRPREQSVIVVDRPGSAQSVVYVGSPGLPRSDKNFFQYQVLNNILGGSFASRLNSNLRERNKYTYGARSYFVWRSKSGPFLVSTKVQTDKTAPAIKEIFSEINRMSRPIPENEIDRARNYIGYRFPAGFETGSDLVSKLALLRLYDLPDDYYNTYVPNIMAVTSQTVKQPAVRFFKNSPKIAVLVGDAKLVAPELQKLGYKVKVVSIEDLLGPSIDPKTGKAETSSK